MSARWRTSDVTVLGVAGAGIVLVTVAAFLASPPDLAPRENGSSFAAHGNGGKAAFLLLKELDYDVQRSYEPAAALARQPEETVLVIANPTRTPSQQDVRALKAFLERGGVILATGPIAAAFVPGAPAAPDATGTQQRAPVAHGAAIPSPLTAGAASIDMSSGATKLPLESAYVPVYGTADEPAVVTARIGSGQAIWWAGSEPLFNVSISRPGHVELLLNAIGPPESRTILWDEFYHGHNRSLWSYVAATPLPLGIAQLGGIAALALFTYSRRRRPIRARVTEPRTSPLEFVETMGGLYQRAGASAAAVATVRAFVRRRLLAACGLPSTSSDDRLAQASAARMGLDSTKLGTLLSDAATASIDPELTVRQAVQIVVELQAVAKKSGV
jgi:hypothetical protein